MSAMDRQAGRFGRGRSPEVQARAEADRVLLLQQHAELTEATRALDAVYAAGPMVLRMQLGPRNGETATAAGSNLLPDGPPPSWLWAVPRPIAEVWTPDGTRVPGQTEVDKYDYTGHIDDDGHRLYRYAGRF